MIINLQDSNQPGSHWIALKRVNNTIFVFDSFRIGYIIILYLYLIHLGLDIYLLVFLRYLKTLK